MVFNVGGNSNSEITADGVKYNDGTVAGALNTVEDELTANGKRIYLDYQDGEYGYNTDPLRGAATFNPFSANRNPELIWVNSDPYSIFGQKTIELNLSKYKALQIKYKRHAGDRTTQYYCYSIFNVPSDNVFIATALDYNQQKVGSCRKVVISANSVFIDYNLYNGMYFNEYTIPLAIYGVTDELI